MTDVRLAEVTLMLLLDIDGDKTSAEALAVSTLTIIGIMFEGNWVELAVGDNLAMSFVSMLTIIDAAVI